jgi:large subunit ribosomal protein L18e
MVKRTGPTNYQTQILLDEIRPIALKSKFWHRMSEEVSKPTRQRRIVNIYKINLFAKDGETVAVPGKVLGVGNINKKVEVAALNFSQEAKDKILAAKGKIMSLKELLDKNPNAKNVKISG